MLSNKGASATLGSSKTSNTSRTDSLELLEKGYGLNTIRELSLDLSVESAPERKPGYI